RRSTSLYFAAARERAVAALCKALTDGGDNNFVIIEVDTSRNYYAQFMTKRDKPDVHGELVSNEWLDEPHKLTEDAQDRLRSLGWHQDRDVGGLGGGNFYKRWVIGVDGVTETTLIEEAL